MKKKLLAVVLIGAMVASLTACGSSSTASTGTTAAITSDNVKDSMKGVTIKVGTSGLFGPFSYYDTDGKTLIGYDLDLLKDLQDILGFTIDGGAIQAMDYSALTTSVTEGKLDVAAAALCATDEKKK